MATVKYTKEWIDSVIAGLQSSEEKRKQTEEEFFKMPAVQDFISKRIYWFWDLYGVLETKELYKESHEKKTLNRIIDYAKYAMVDYLRNHFSWESFSVTSRSAGRAVLKSSYLWVDAQIRRAVIDEFNEIYEMNLSKEEFNFMTVTKKSRKVGYFCDYTPEEIWETLRGWAVNQRRFKTEEAAKKWVINKAAAIQYKLRPLFPGVSSERMNKEFPYDSYIIYPEDKVNNFRERAAYSYAMHHPHASKEDIKKKAEEFGITESRMAWYVQLSFEEIFNLDKEENAELIKKFVKSGLIKPENEELITYAVTGGKISDYAREHNIKENTANKIVNRFKKKFKETYVNAA